MISSVWPHCRLMMASSASRRKKRPTRSRQSDRRRWLQKNGLLCTFAAKQKAAGTCTASSLVAIVTAAFNEVAVLFVVDAIRDSSINFS